MIYGLIPFAAMLTFVGLDALYLRRRNRRRADRRQP